MHCNQLSSQSEEASFASVLIRVLPACILWGSGTAVGEVPPYLVSRAAALSGQIDEEGEEMMKETEGKDAFSRMKKWMIDFVERHGFLGVLLMAAWPNAAFDLVGICCGQLGVTFFNFFVPTLIGKGIIKVSGQAIFFCVWFRNPEPVINSLVNVVQRLKEVVPAIPITAETVRSKLQEALEQVSKGKVKEDGEPGWLKYIGERVIIAVMVVFLLTTVQQLAQGRQKMMDDRAIEKQKKTK